MGNWSLNWDNAMVKIIFHFSGRLYLVRVISFFGWFEVNWTFFFGRPRLKRWGAPTNSPLNTVLLYYTNHTHQFSASNNFCGARSYGWQQNYYRVQCECSFSLMLCSFSYVYLNKEIKKNKEPFMRRVNCLLPSDCTFCGAGGNIHLIRPFNKFFFLSFLVIYSYREFCSHCFAQSTSDLHIILMINDWKITINYTRTTKNAPCLVCLWICVLFHQKPQCNS